MAGGEEQQQLPMMVGVIVKKEAHKVVVLPFKDIGR